MLSPSFEPHGIVPVLLYMGPPTGNSHRGVSGTGRRLDCPQNLHIHNRVSGLGEITQLNYFIFSDLFKEVSLCGNTVRMLSIF